MKNNQYISTSNDTEISGIVSALVTIIDMDNILPPAITAKSDKKIMITEKNTQYKWNTQYPHILYEDFKPQTNG